MKKIIFSIMFLFVFVSNVYASSCTKNPEYIKWENLPIDEQKNILEPMHDICILDDKEVKALSNSNTEKIVEGTNGLVSISKNDSSYDARDYGLITPVENQKSLPNCWIHSGNSLLETAAILNGFSAYNFSEKHVVVNSIKKVNDLWINDDGYNNTTSAGGNGIYYASYLFNHVGPIFESDYAYNFFDSRDYQNLTKSSLPNKTALLDVDEFSAYITSDGCTNNKIDLIKELVLKYGSVSSAIYSNGSMSSYYNYTDTSNVVNHAITIIGWDDNIPASKFRDAKRNGAFLIKNSWGNSGLNGYNYISYDDANVCNDTYILSGVRINDFDNTYKTSNQIYPYTIRPANNVIYYSMKFNTKNAKEYLSKVSYYTIGDTTAELYFSKSSKSDYSKLLGTNHTIVDGVSSINFEDIEVSGEFYINIKLTLNDDTILPVTCVSNNPLDKSYTISTSSNNQYFYSADGKSFIDFNSTDYHLSDGTKLSSCRPNIYAYTKNEPSKKFNFNVINTNPKNHTIKINETYTIRYGIDKVIDYKLFDTFIYNDNFDDVSCDFKINTDYANNKVEVIPSVDVKDGEYMVRIAYGNHYSNAKLIINTSGVIKSEKYQIENNKILVSPKRDSTITVEEFKSNIIFSSGNSRIEKNAVSLNDSDIISTGTIINDNNIEYVIVIPGDIYGDGEVDSVDLLYLKQALLNKRSLDEYSYKAADLAIDDDNTLDSVDLLYLKRFLLGKMEL